MMQLFLCLLIATCAYAQFDGIGDAVGGVVNKEVTGVVTDEASKVVGDKVGGQIGSAAGELAGSVVSCYINGVLTTGTGCSSTDLEAAAGKAAGEIVGDLGKDLKDAATNEIGKVVDSVTNGIGGEAGKIVGGAVGDVLNGAVNAVAAADKYPDCAGMKSYCTNTFYKDMMSEMCPKTCGTSGASSATAAPAAPATATPKPAPAAVDTSPQCASMKSYCTNAAYKSFMATNCAKTCGVTSTPTTSGSTSSGSTSGSTSSGSTTGSTSGSTSSSTGVKQEAACQSAAGMCMYESDCKGTLKTGLCPTQAANIKCCISSSTSSSGGSTSSGSTGSGSTSSGSGSTSSGSTSSGSTSSGSSSSSGPFQETACANAGGTCKYDTDCTGTAKTGLCPSQASNVKCCVPDSGSSSSKSCGSDSPPSGYSKAVDIAIDLFSVDKLTCIKNEGFKMAIVRVYSNGGFVDSNALQNMANAKTAGLDVQIYHFPAPEQSGATQFDTMYNHVTGGGWSFSFVWLDVENIANGPKWSSDKSANQKVIDDFVTRANAKGVRVGIYTRDTNWPDVTGTWKGPSTVSKIWFWQVPDTTGGCMNDKTTSGLKSFGQWSPSNGVMKQYSQNHKSLCNLNADLNSYPTGSFNGDLATKN